MGDSLPNVRIVLWRHGQTDWNVENRFQGHSDIPLNKVGEYQVVEAAKILASLKPDRIVSSDLIRAQKTAAALSAITNIKVEINPGIRETNGGLWEGKTATENRSTHSELFSSWYEGGDEPAGEIGEKPTRKEGSSSWILLDYTDLVVHIQSTELRNYYMLDRLWNDCPKIDLGIEMSKR